MPSTTVASSGRTLPLALALLAVAGRPSSAEVPTANFVHPGLLHSAADLDRIRLAVRNGTEPWAGAWRAFRAGHWLAADYRPRSLAIVGRGVGATGQDNISNDCTAAYYNAVAWSVTGDERYARKAVEIINAWSYTCHKINGKDAVLCAGIYGYKLLNAAEILRYSYPAWSPKDVAQFTRLMRDVFYPVLADFAPFANGNWDAAAMTTVMSIGVFCDDRPMFDRAVNYYLDGSGDGSILHYVIDDAGQLEESGRDQQHAQLGIGLLSCAAETAWHQGVDLYGAFDNRLLKGFEYTIRYGLGEPVPFDPTHDQTGKYNHPRISAPGPLKMQIYEMVFNHYVNRRGVVAQYTTRAAAEHRPETLAIDQVGGGTLLFTLPPYRPATTRPAAVPAQPAAVIAKGTDRAVSLLWAAVVDADRYTVKRSEPVAGPWSLVAPTVAGTTWTDEAVEPGRLYHYTVSAQNAAGASVDALPTAACAGLPTTWVDRDVGPVGVPGRTLYDGTTFTLDTAGTGLADSFHFAGRPVDGDGDATIVARFVPQVASQFAQLGLMARPADGGPAVSVTVVPRAGKDIEVPGWYLRFGPVDPGVKLDAPTVSWGRLTGPVWLRLARSGDTFTAATSVDGQAWTPVGGSVVLPMRPPVLVGLAGCSGLPTVATRVSFDHVAITPAH